jgi:chemotaxis protein MotC
VKAAALALCAALLACGPALAGGGAGQGKPAETAAPPRPAPPPPPTPAAAAAPEADQPWRLTRALHRLQARIGEGDGAAQAAQGDLVADLARRFDAAPDAVWDDRRNAAAQMVLLLSGADPRPARRRLERGVFGAHDGAARAGLAFAEGDDAAALRLLLDLDASHDDLPRAHAALVAATLIAAGPAAGRGEAHALFDRARLLAPGLLPEEAALRRQARLAEERGERARFAFLAARHLRRYPRSVYAPPFRARLPRALADMAAAAPPAQSVAALEEMAALLDAFSPPERAAALDALARRALSTGRAELARAAAARMEAGADEPARRRAALYALAARALGGDPQVVEALERAEGGDPDSEALRRAALALARQVVAWPPAPPARPVRTAATPEAPADKAAPTAKPPQADMKPPHGGASPPAPPSEAAILKALAQGDELLRAAPRVAAPRPPQPSARREPP